MIKITNAMMSILITSPPVLRPKARLAIAVRVQMPERIPKITLDILFRKMPIHWINTIGCISRRDQHLFFLQLLCDLSRTHAGVSHIKDTLDHQ